MEVDQLARHEEAMSHEEEPLCSHENWSDDEECKCGGSLSHCLNCYATIQDIEDEQRKSRIEELEGEIEEWKLATGLLDSNGDPDGVTPSSMEVDRVKMLDALSRIGYLAVSGIEP